MKDPWDYNQRRSPDNIELVTAAGCETRPPRSVPRARVRLSGSIPSRAETGWAVRLEARQMKLERKLEYLGHEDAIGVVALEAGRRSGKCPAIGSGSFDVDGFRVPVQAPGRAVARDHAPPIPRKELGIRRIESEANRYRTEIGIGFEHLAQVEGVGLKTHVDPHVDLPGELQLRLNGRVHVREVDLDGPDLIYGLEFLERVGVESPSVSAFSGPHPDTIGSVGVGPVIAGEPGGARFNQGQEKVDAAGFVVTVAQTVRVVGSRKAIDLRGGRSLIMGIDCVVRIGREFGRVAAGDQKQAG